MDALTQVITAGGVSTLILEGAKWVIRKWILKEPDFDFPTGFYVVAIPVLNVLVVPLLALLAVEGFTLPADWLEWVRTVVQILIASLITLVGYNAGIQPLKEYSRGLRNGEVGG
jgi:drug/metabolite transporter (DMT)-like permease